MTLYEIGLEYENSSALLSARLSELRKELAVATDPDEVWHLKRRIYELTPMLTECNRQAKRCKNYYAVREVGRGRSARSVCASKSQKNGKIDFNNSKRTYAAASGSSSKGSNGGPNNGKRSFRTRRLQEYNLQNLSSGNA